MTMTNPFQTQNNAQPFGQMQQIQQMFPQPQGTVYAIQNPVEIGNVPIGSTGLSVAICLSGNIMYIKSFQNGQPIIMAYRIIPFQKEEHKEEPATTPTSQIDTFNSRLAALEEKLNKLLSVEGGKFDGLL